MQQMQKIIHYVCMGRWGGEEPWKLLMNSTF